MYLAVMLLSVKCRFQNHCSDGKPNAKVQPVNQTWSTASQYKHLCKVFCNHCCAGKFWIPFVTLIFALSIMYFFYFLCIFLYLSVITFTPINKVLVIIIGHVKMYLVKTNSEKNWHGPCLVEEKQTFLRWFYSNIN